jgi:hypothetical protein
MRAMRVGAVLVVIGAAVGLGVAPAVADDVTVIPGGPPVASSGTYEGSGQGQVGPVDFRCQAPQFITHIDTSGGFSHPSPSAGTYEFHLQICSQPSGPDTVVRKGRGTFVLDTSARDLAGTFSMEPSTGDSHVVFWDYTYDLRASGACKARFRVDGTMTRDIFSFDFEEAGTLTQIGSIVCRGLVDI